MNVATTSRFLAGITPILSMPFTAEEEIDFAALAGEVPAATAILPTAALGDRSGGPVVTDPSDTQGTRTLEPVFLFDVRVTATPLQRVGGRVWVRFDHGASPLAIQWQRRLLQLFLKQFNPQA